MTWIGRSWHRRSGRRPRGSTGSTRTPASAERPALSVEDDRASPRQYELRVEVCGAGGHGIEAHVAAPPPGNHLRPVLPSQEDVLRPLPVVSVLLNQRRPKAPIERGEREVGMEVRERPILACPPVVTTVVPAVGVDAVPRQCCHSPKQKEREGREAHHRVPSYPAFEPIYWPAPLRRIIVCHGESVADVRTSVRDLSGITTGPLSASVRSRQRRDG
jgi:hypothetical protein